MFNSFLSKFKTLFGSPAATPPEPNTPVIPVSPAEAPAAVGADKSNRVVFVAKKTAKKSKAVSAAVPATAGTQPTSPVYTPPAIDVQVKTAAAAQVIIDNARRLEAAAAAKEAEVFQRLKSLDDKERYLIQKEQSLDSKDQQVSKKLEAIDELYRKQLDKLEAISGLDVEKAKQLLMSSTEKKMSSWLAKKIDETKDGLKTRQEELAKEIILDGITHGVTDYVAEYTVSTMTLPMTRSREKLSAAKAAISVLLKKLPELNWNG